MDQRSNLVHRRRGTHAPVARNKLCGNAIRDADEVVAERRRVVRGGSPQRWGAMAPKIRRPSWCGRTLSTAAGTLYSVPGTEVDFPAAAADRASEATRSGVSKSHLGTRSRAPSRPARAVNSVSTYATISAMWMVLEGHQTWREAGSTTAELILRSLGIDHVEAQQICASDLPALPSRPTRQSDA
jgi:hypothetical protein